MVSLTESALLTACMLDARIGVAVFGQRTLSIYRERIAGCRTLESTAPYAAGHQSIRR